ncbi:hypothetical protein Taro_034445 [Colocasia esculenta]|uniref:Uncharacterized protein n=1 Tax=Colocasia esculenta TaxID=4460 RepID=A0A843W2Y6_COLES|nr:hypothetical protein [Colocasia esculenta]
MVSRRQAIGPSWSYLVCVCACLCVLVVLLSLRGSSFLPHSCEELRTTPPTFSLTLPRFGSWVAGQGSGSSEMIEKSRFLIWDINELLGEWRLLFSLPPQIFAPSRCLLREGAPSKVQLPLPPPSSLGRSTTYDFLLSISDVAAPSPSVHELWSTVALYTDQIGANITCFVSIAREVITEAVATHHLPVDHRNGVYLVLTAPEVSIQDFCHVVCGFHFFTFPFVVVGHTLAYA